MAERFALWSCGDVWVYGLGFEFAFRSILTFRYQET